MLVIVAVVVVVAVVRVTVEVVNSTHGLYPEGHVSHPSPGLYARQTLDGLAHGPSPIEHISSGHIAPAGTV